jgi:hypothetical protein
MDSWKKPKRKENKGKKIRFIRNSIPEIVSRPHVVKRGPGMLYISPNIDKDGA